MWSDLALPWQECLKLAWDAYCDDCIPIGAVVTDLEGHIISHGRNRIFEKGKPGRTKKGAALAHAEVEALHKLDFDAIDPQMCSLFTTTEPCPMCMGALYMSGIRNLYFGARDPYAGSVNMLGSTWYLSRKPIRVVGPESRVEKIVEALYVEQETRKNDGCLPEGLFWEMHKKVIPEGVNLGLELTQSKSLRHLLKQGLPTQDVMDWLLSQVK